MTIAYADYSSNLKIDQISATISGQNDIRISKIALKSALNGATSSFEEYNAQEIMAGISLPADNSKVTYAIDIVNLGNVKMGIYDVTGLPDNLQYSFDSENYVIKDVLCDNNDASDCVMGIKKTVYVTIEYKENQYSPYAIDYNLNLHFDFRQVYSISYQNIINNNYPTKIMANDTLIIDFGNDVPSNVSVLGVGGYNYSSPILTISNPVDDVVISEEIYLHYDKLVFDGTNYTDTEE